MKRFLYLTTLVDEDGEFFQSQATMECLAQMSTLKYFYIGENNITSAILHRRSLEGSEMNNFHMKISTWAEICKNKPLEKLEKLYICGSHLMRGGSQGLEYSLKSVLTTFNVLKILKIENATCLLQSSTTIESLALLFQLETIDFRRSEIAILKISISMNPSSERTASWCDEYLHFFPKSLKNIYIETEASARNIFNYAEQNEMKDSMMMLRNKVLESLPNLHIFSCEAFPTFSRIDVKAWYSVIVDNTIKEGIVL
mmetsp:Transcript_4380/g.4523  ORF Transcript_4380/g.4523 Transcript_4380/m.4523 type:complete len:256 (-) Transcript_4380:158-925(-)